MRRMKIIVAMLAVLSVLFVLPVQASKVSIPTFELYSPAKIVIGFSYTKNVTCTVTTLGQSLYEAITGPTSVTFDTSAFDVFTILVTITYSTPVNQTVNISFFEGGRAAKNMQVAMADSAISLMFKISVVQAPSYPSATDIADAMMQRWQNQLSDFEASQRGLTDEMANTVSVVGALGVIAFVVCIICVMAVFYIQRRVAELSEWGVRHRAEHAQEAN